MDGEQARDVARQAANLGGAIAQIAVGGLGAAVTGNDVGRVSDENRTLVVPAGYAFAIWGAIFALALGYALYQALPGRREDRLLRGIGWWTAGAYWSNSLWILLFPARQFLLAQIVIVGIWLCVAVAVVRFVRHGGGRAGGWSGVERWLIAPGLGLFFGWVTAANFVSVATTGVAVGWLDGGAVEAVLGAVLLLLGGLVGTAIVAFARQGPTALWLTSGSAVLWALAAVVVNQRDDSLATTGAAIVAAVPVAVALLFDVRGPALRRPTGGRPPRAAAT